MSDIHYMYIFVHLETDEVRQAKDGGHTFAKTSGHLKTWLPTFSSLVVDQSRIIKANLRLATVTCFWFAALNLIFVLLLPIIAVSHSGMPPPVPAQEPSESQSLQRVEIVRGWG